MSLARQKKFLENYLIIEATKVFGSSCIVSPDGTIVPFNRDSILEKYSRYLKNIQ